MSDTNAPPVAIPWPVRAEIRMWAGTLADKAWLLNHRSGEMTVSERQQILADVAEGAQHALAEAMETDLVSAFGVQPPKSTAKAKAYKPYAERVNPAELAQLLKKAEEQAVKVEPQEMLDRPDDFGREAEEMTNRLLGPDYELEKPQ